MLRRVIVSLALALGLLLSVAAPASAHQPFFEGKDIKAEHPWWIDQPMVSTALYATLESRDDVDYYAFAGKAGEDIFLSIVIPQIAGQEDFVPTMALLGEGLPTADLPARVVRPEGGALLIAPPPGPAPTFFEPFSRTSYWERQEERVALPADGRYVVAIWHPEGQVGRYVFVIGEREEPGGDLAFPLKIRQYWTPVEEPASAADSSCGNWWSCFVQDLRERFGR